MKYLKFSKFRFAQDEWFGRHEFDFLRKVPIHDKFGHLFRDYLFVQLVYFAFVVFDSDAQFKLEFALGISLLFNLLWEIKDGFLYYEDCPEDAPKMIRYFYGDGFSFKDMIAGIMGSIGAFFQLHFFISKGLNNLLIFALCLVIAYVVYYIYHKYIIDLLE